MDYGGGVDEGGSVNDGGSVDDGGGVVSRGVVGSGIVRRSVMADDALGGHRAVVQRQESGAGGGQHSAEGEHLDTENTFIISIYNIEINQF